MGGRPSYESSPERLAKKADLAEMKKQAMMELVEAEIKVRALNDETRKLNEATKEIDMAKEKESKLVNRHKRMAEGEKIELKKGGMAKKKEHKAEHKSKKK